jgi:hypothetical protein
MVQFSDLMNIKERTIDLSERPSNYIAFVMDHSGSMLDVREQSRTNFNEKLRHIKESMSEQNNYVTLIEFDGIIQEKYANVLIDYVEELKTYWIGGMTALYDSIMTAISIIEASMPEDGDNAALINIITDGYENSSTENKGEVGRLRVKKRIEELQSTGKWTFVFMGADQDVLETAVEGLGINAGNTFSYTNDSEGLSDTLYKYKASINSYSESRTRGVMSTVNFFDGGKSND